MALICSAMIMLTSPTSSDTEVATTSCSGFPPAAGPALAQPSAAGAVARNRTTFEQPPTRSQLVPHQTAEQPAHQRRRNLRHALRQICAAPAASTRAGGAETPTFRAVTVRTSFESVLAHRLLRLSHGGALNPRERAAAAGSNSMTPGTATPPFALCARSRPGRFSFAATPFRVTHGARLPACPRRDRSRPSSRPPAASGGGPVRS